MEPLVYSENESEYLTVDEVAQRLKVKKKTIQNKMTAGIFQRGVHYFRPSGLGPRFKWSAVVAWLEAQEPKADDNEQDEIPMARGYKLGSPRESLKTASGIQGYGKP